MRSSDAACCLRALGLLLTVTGCALEPVPVEVAPPVPSSATPAVDLVPPPIISRFGDWHGAGGVPRPWQHSGIDIRVPIGTAVLAAADGIVLRVSRGPLAGLYIVLGHTAELSTAYYHLSAIGVVAGQPVRRGDLIGRAGMTGNATAPHVHFGVCRYPAGQCGGRIEAGWADPAAYWVAEPYCFVAGRPVTTDPVRFTYPVPCAS